MSRPSYDVIVIGEGVSGLAAAAQAARAGLAVATLEANLFGGLVLNVNELDPAPSGRPASGAELAAELMQECSGLGVASIQEAATALGAEAGRFRVATAGGEYLGRAVIVASGARLKKLGVPGEDEFAGRGVSSCADCDGPMYQDEEVVVVGGGDSALQEALVLAKFCRRVYVVHRGARFRARAAFVERAAADPRITIMWNSRVEAILGGKMVERVRLRREPEGRSEELACAGVFVYVGLAPNSEFLPPAVRRDAQGFVEVDEGLETALDGLWAVGAVRAGYSGLLADAVEEAQRAARAVASRLVP
jgi:thioredoxin reductase (NADPH)